MPIYEIPFKGRPDIAFWCCASNLEAAKSKYVNSGELTNIKEISIEECVAKSGLTKEYITGKIRRLKESGQKSWWGDLGGGKLVDSKPEGDFRGGKSKR